MQVRFLSGVCLFSKESRCDSLFFCVVIIMSIIRQCVRSAPILLAVAVTTMTLGVMADLTIPWLLQILIDDGVAQQNIPVVRQSGRLMLLVVVLGLLVSFIAYWTSAKASANIGRHLRTTLYDHILSLDYEHYNALSTSSLITRLSNDILHIQNMFLMLQRVAVKVPISFVMGLVLSIKLSPSLSLTYLVTVPLLCINMAVYVRFSAFFFPKIQSAIDQINLRAQEMLLGLLTIKGMRAAKEVIAGFKQSSEKLLSLNLAIQKRFGVVAPTSMIIFNYAIVAVLCLGFWGFTKDIGKLIAFVTYSMQILSAVITSSSVLTMLTRARASVKRVSEILETPVETPIDTPEIPENVDIVVDHLSYRFPDSNRDRLCDVSCRIPFGQRVGIVGLPGSGKTLFLNALAGLLENYRGTVTYGEVSLRHIPREWLHQKIGYVQQSATILSGTIRDNLLLATGDLSLDELTEALDHAMASELYQLNADSVERSILQRGQDLSGGQKQRLSIARILAMKPAVLMLDDSTSALDHDTEKRFFKNLDKLRPQTQIIVSQRLSSLRQCDTILLFDNGRIVARGSHRTLLETTPLYEMILGDQLIEEAFIDE